MSQDTKREGIETVQGETKDKRRKRSELTAGYFRRSSIALRVGNTRGRSSLLPWISEEPEPCRRACEHGRWVRCRRRSFPGQVGVFWVFLWCFSTRLRENSVCCSFSIRQLESLDSWSCLPSLSFFFVCLCLVAGAQPIRSSDARIGKPRF